jgi:hypothetical protein
MIRFASYLCSLILVTLFATYSYAGDGLNGRSCIELSVGSAFWSQSSVSQSISVSGVRTTAKSGGLSGALSYSYWLQEDLSIHLSMGMFVGEASSSVDYSGVSQRASIVVPILLGLKYYLPAPSPDSRVRSYLSGAVGPFIGFEGKNNEGWLGISQEAHSETALGARIGGGIDFLVGRTFKLGVNVGYNLMTDFANPIGARKNFNGPDFSLGFGIVFGSGVE